MKEILSIHNLSKQFDGKLAVNNLSLTIYEGEIFVLLGPNGAGKTTTLKLISGLLKPDSGEISICGINALKNPLEAKSKIGLLYEQPYLYPKLTGMEFINFMLDIYQVKAKEEEVKSLLAKFEILDIANELIENYSFGMKQKLMLTSIFLRKPKLYLLDEPFFGLDPKAQANLIEMLKSDRNSAKLISTHITSLAEKVADRIGILLDGKLISVGEKNEILSSESLENFFLQLTK